MTPIEALLKEVNTDDSAVISHHLKDAENRVTHLFLVSKQSIKILRDNHNILLLDCTYKTNKYQIPRPTSQHVDRDTEHQTTIWGLFSFTKKRRKIICKRSSVCIGFWYYQWLQHFLIWGEVLAARQAAGNELSGRILVASIQFKTPSRDRYFCWKFMRKNTF
jgi:hypothetical protein